MKLTKIFQQFTVRGEFEGQPFEADYSSNDGWQAGNGITCLNEDFVNDEDAYDEWYERLLELLWEQGFEAAE